VAGIRSTCLLSISTPPQYQNKALQQALLASISVNSWKEPRRPNSWVVYSVQVRGSWVYVALRQRSIHTQLLGVMNPSPGFSQKQAAGNTVSDSQTLPVLASVIRSRIRTGGGVIFPPSTDRSCERTNTERHNQKVKVQESAGTSGEAEHHSFINLPQVPWYRLTPNVTNPAAVKHPDPWLRSHWRHCPQIL